MQKILIKPCNNIKLPSIREMLYETSKPGPVYIRPLTLPKPSPPKKKHIYTKEKINKAIAKKKGKTSRFYSEKIKRTIFTRKIKTYHTFMHMTCNTCTNGDIIYDIREPSGFTLYRCTVCEKHLYTTCHFCHPEQTPVENMESYLERNKLEKHIKRMHLKK